MYKLTATLKTGQRFITNSANTTDLARIAVNLGAIRYEIVNRLTGEIAVIRH